MLASRDAQPWCTESGIHSIFETILIMTHELQPPASENALDGMEFQASVMLVWICRVLNLDVDVHTTAGIIFSTEEENL